MTVAIMARRRAPSATTQRGVAFVEAHEDEAAALGRELAELVHDPEELSRALARGLERLSDAEYRAGQEYVAPGIGRTYGVRNPLLATVARELVRGTEDVSPALVLFVAERLARDDVLEPRWLAFRLLESTLLSDPERSWQLMRQAAREAADWITVDSLAHPVAKGILRAPFRWAEIEQLVFSASRWDRRLVGSAIATMPFADRRAGRTPEYVHRSLPLLAELIGDADPNVQKALAWAYRSVAMVDPTATAAALAREADQAAATADGHRAWVIRDALPKLEASDQHRLKSALAGIRRRRDAPSTSRASETARRFAGLTN